jgi:hypothetical protein
MPVIAHSRGVLTLEAMKGEAGWDAALNLPLPPRPGFYLLDEARQHVIAYLDWVTHDLAQGPPPDELRRQIDHAAARLLEISLALCVVLDSDNCDDC